MKGVYLLHFDRPFGHAKHYTGYSDDIWERLVQHHNGNGSRLVHHVRAAGIGFRVARIWKDADRKKERQLKRSGGASRYCPICKPNLRIKNNGLNDLISGSFEGVKRVGY